MAVQLWVASQSVYWHRLTPSSSPPTAHHLKTDKTLQIRHLMTRGQVKLFPPPMIMGLGWVFQSHEQSKPH